MPEKQRLQPAVILAVLIGLAGSHASSAQGFQDRDTKEISSYALTEAGLLKYMQAAKNLGALTKKIPGNCAEGDEAKSLNDFMVRFNAIPGVQTAVQSAGMTTREYVVFMFSLFQNGMAAWALDQPGGKLAPGISKANVDFYKKHETALKKVQGPKESDDCDDDRRDDARSEDDSES